jgi:hypothetical protein
MEKQLNQFQSETRPAVTSQIVFCFFANNVPNFHARRDADGIKYTLRTGRSSCTSSEVFPCSQPLLMRWWPLTIFQDAVDSISAESRSWGKGYEKLPHRKKIGKISLKYQSSLVRSDIFFIGESCIYNHRKNIGEISLKYHLHWRGPVFFISMKVVYATMIIYRLKIIIYTYIRITHLNSLMKILLYAD